MKRYRVQIKRGRKVRLTIYAIGTDSCSVAVDHSDKCEDGEYVSVRAIPGSAA